MPPLRRTGADPEAEDPGQAGQYRLEGRLGSGGMGVVHLARSASGLPLAVKVVHAEYAVDPEFRARFRQEVAAARLVSGAFTAPVVDADPDGERPWMATLYIPGPTLSERVKRNGPLSADEVRRLAAGLAEALRDIHRAGVVHRDLKPSNVLLAEDGPKVIDFGISRPYDSELRTETGKLIGTPPFMAPEQFQRPREVGPAADVFALASLLVHAATGRGPFESESPYIVAYQVVHNEPDLTGVPEDLVPLIRACLAKDPAERPTPDAIMARLPYAAHGVAGGADTFPHASLLSPPSLSPSSSSPAPRDSDPTHVRAASSPVPAAPGSGGPAPAAGRARRRRAPWIVAAAVALSALGAGGYWLLRGGDDPHAPLRTRPTAAGSDWRPWETSVPGDGAGDGRVRAGFCAYGEAALYCSAPGVQAARIDTAGGKVAWRRPAEDGKPGQGAAPADAERAGGLAPPAPVVSGGLVHVTTPDGSRLTALDPATGEPRWTRNVSVYGGRVYHAGDTVLLVSADGTVTAVDGATDRQLWSHRLPGHAKPVFSSYGGGTAYAVSPAGGGGHRTQVLALDARRGTTLWQRTVDGDLTAVGAGPRDALYLTAADSDNRVSAVVRYDPADRSERRVPLGTPLNATSAVAYGDSVYLLSTDGGLTAVGTAKGAKSPGQLWRLDTAVANGSALVATDRRLYFSAADGRLLAVDTGRGALLGQTAPRLTKAGRGYLDLLPAPVAADGKVFGAAPDGTVFAVSDHDPGAWR
ncbi:serine/threonine protein kinase [Streptomyces eurocidicus]|uniref:Serine/threonine protein kinase n=1 Tax=Streptomyces eurocidicus TaxID=66423 RepID=A0A2N8NX47_STREU|nr:serine/threonine-protein kinase [Streptomyces eurocidicus]MBB5120369.1 serine/threonine protein kinase [Streptomyces eurocidicus]MBF6054048.1 PQQ-binding-like beta-propeller repeat protein [Streptomyces eurocidicus]PNE33347.1 serine/threonine protein kinase [Streptomyces eurocidicus]